jgi:transcription antitermination factor NusG
MTSKQDFTDEAWTRIRRAPLVAGVAISLADPGGPIELAKETMATLRSATLPPSHEELLASVALAIQAMTQHKQNPLGTSRRVVASRCWRSSRPSTSW